MSKGRGKTYDEILPQLPRMLRAEDAEDYVAGPTMLRELGVQPAVKRKGLTVYDRLDLDRAIDALKLKEAVKLLPKPKKP